VSAGAHRAGGTGEGGAWRAVLFDLDGTLADTVPLILASYRHAVTRLRGGWDEEGQEAWKQYIGRPLRDAVRDFGRDEAESEALLRGYVEFQDEAHDRMVTAFPGVREVVSAIEARGVPQALVTSKARRMALRTLEVCGFSGTFPVVVTADEVQRGKPDPEPVVLALRELGEPEAGATVFVGDSPHDIVAGRAAGVVTVGVTWGAFPAQVLRASEPHHLVDSVEELGRILTGR
jgi:pyrophosphatase PpaX